MGKEQRQPTICGEIERNLDGLDEKYRVLETLRRMNKKLLGGNGQFSIFYDISPEKGMMGIELNWNESSSVVGGVLHARAVLLEAVFNWHLRDWMQSSRNAPTMKEGNVIRVEIESNGDITIKSGRLVRGGISEEELEEWLVNVNGPFHLACLRTERKPPDARFFEDLQRHLTTAFDKSEWFQFSSPKL